MSFCMLNGNKKIIAAIAHKQVRNRMKQLQQKLRFSQLKQADCR